MTASKDPSEVHGSRVGIPDLVTRAAEQVVTAAFGRLLTSDLRVTSAAEGKRLLAEDDSTEELADSIQRFVAVATPVVRVVARGARFTRVPWVLVASSTLSLGVTVRAGVRELQVLASYIEYRLERATGVVPDPMLVQKLTLELYISPRRTPDVTSLRFPFIRLARRWVVSGALGRDTRRSTVKALDRVDALDLPALAARVRS